MSSTTEEETQNLSFASHPTSVKVHPLVLLSVVDHYNRVAKDTNNRVVGVLLGSYDRRTGVVEVTNSFAVPFEEDLKDPSIWFLDHNFVDNMFGMYRRVAVREVIIGWYSTGPKIKPSDINIHNQIFSKYISQPVYVIVDVKLQHSTGTIPTEAYYSVEEAEDEKSQPKLTFAHVESEIAAQEAEEIGVEHLLRDVKDTTISDLNSSVSTRLSSLHAFRSKLKEIYDYLNQVENSKLPTNHQIMYLLQDVFNLLPGLQQHDTHKAFITETNDSMLTMYLAGMSRSIIALHNLISNKIDLRQEERKLAEKIINGPSEEAKKEKKESKNKEEAKSK